AILINIGIFSGLYLLIIQNKQLKRYEKYCLAFTILWLSIFLIILKSFTGILLLIIVGYGHLFYFITRIKNEKIKKALKVSFFIIPLIIIIYIIRSVIIYYNIEKIDFSKLEQYTINGNPYQHCTNIYGFENGNYVWINICEKELKEEWFKRSEFEYDGKDKKGQSIKYTLIRYLASKGLKKDSAGMSELTDKDIKNIELGKANYLFGKKFSFYPRIYELIWEIDNFLHGGNPSGHSITQRIVYIKTGLLIFKDNFFIGTGTGDVKLSFNKKYEETGSDLSKKWRLRAHNQFITFMLTFGIIGFLWISFAVLYPIRLEKKWNNYFFVLIFGITMLCMINEDTLETHVGASMIAYFYSLFLLGYENHIKIKEIQ
ncbi:MAG: O-antigen ligase family protein, partial [Bacteroidales bacterium]|nr:O-antigen ligase family protein [Bacteroidales bacterium]